MTQVVDEQNLTLDEKLAAIEEAIKHAAGDVKKEIELLTAISDPQESLNCEGCQ